MQAYTEEEFDKLVLFSLTEVLLQLQSFLGSKQCPAPPLAVMQHTDPHSIESRLPSTLRTQGKRCREVIPGARSVLVTEYIFKVSVILCQHRVPDLKRQKTPCVY